MDNILIVVVFFLLTLLTLVFLWDRIVIEIDAGEAGVLFRRFYGGTVVDRVYPEGFEIINPFNIMTRYNVRVQTTHHEMDVLTKRGLSIHLVISMRYHPEYELLGVLHKEVGPEYVDIIVIPEVEAALRKIIGQYEAEEFYGAKKAITESVINEATEQIGQRFVKLDDVVIRKIILTEAIKKAIEEKLKQKHLYQAYEFRLQRERQEAERKFIEAKGIKDHNDIVNLSLTDNMIKWKGIHATLELAKSNNSKVVVIGAGGNGVGLPLMLPVGTGQDVNNALNQNALQDATANEKKLVDNAAPIKNGEEEVGEVVEDVGNETTENEDAVVMAQTSEAESAAAEEQEVKKTTE